MMEAIQTLIDKALKPIEKPLRYDKKWSPHAFGRCYRYQYWLRKDLPITNPPDARVQRIFASGKLFHNFVQEILVKQDPTIQTEVLVETDDVEGYADIVNTEEITDIKSQHSQSFWYRKKEENNIREKLYPNWLQVMWYCQELGKKRGRLVFVSKDDLCIQEYFQDNDDYWKVEISNELKILKMFWDANKLPSAQPRCYKDKKTGKFKECDYCSWKNKCQKIEKGE